MNQLTVKAVFKGEHKSCGYNHSDEYTLHVSHRKDTLITITKAGGGGFCEYESMIAFLTNWDNIRSISTQSDKTDNVFYELLVINNDRVEGYAQAAEQAKDNVLKIVFTRFSNQSKAFVNQLREHVVGWENMRNQPEVNFSGKLHRVRSDMSAALAGSNRRSILNCCEFGEDLSKKVYDDILNSKTEGLSSAAISLIRQQRMLLHEGHDMIRSMRDRA